MVKLRHVCCLLVVLLGGAALPIVPVTSQTFSNNTRDSPQTILPVLAQVPRSQTTKTETVRSAASYSRDTFPSGTSRIKVVRYSTATESPQLNAAQIDAVMNEIRTKYESWSGGKWTFTHIIEEATVDSFDCLGTANSLDRNKTEFDHLIEYGPVTSAKCRFAGLGTLGGPWVLITSDNFSAATVAHELGHNLGLDHARSVTCATQLTPWSECSYREYGDVVAVMGLGSETFGGLATAALDWHDPSRIQVGVNGDFDIAQSSAALVLPDPAGNGEYWIEYVRTANVSRLSADQVVVRRVGMNILRETGTLLIDRNPASTYTMDGGFFTGDTFTDPTGTLNVQVLSLGDTARIRVSGATRPTVSIWPSQLRSIETNEGWLSIDMPTTTSHTQALEIKTWQSDGTTTMQRLRPNVKAVPIPNFKQVVAVQVTARELDGIGASSTYVIRKNPWVKSPATAKAIKSGSRISIATPSAFQRMKVTCSGHSPRVFINLSRTVTVTGTGKTQDCLATFETLTGDVMTASESIALPKTKNNWVEVGARIVGDAGNYSTGLDVSRSCRKCPQATIVVERWNGSKWVRVKKTTTKWNYWEWNTKKMAPMWRIKVDKTTYTPITLDPPVE